MLSDLPSETSRLLAAARTGDQELRAQLLQRYSRPLSKLLHGRLAPSVSLETGDIVQSVLITALSELERFEYRGVGSFWRYLRTIAIRRAQEENRRQLSRPHTAQDSEALSRSPSLDTPDPADQMLEREASKAFDQAIQKLDDQLRDALLLRFELDLAYGQIASECGYPTAEAARMAIGRGLKKLSHSLAAWKEA